MLQAKEGKCNLVDEKDSLHPHGSQKIINTKLIPKIVPLFDGHELNINQQLISNGLSTFSVRSMKTNETAIKKRNSFFNLHRPELKGLNIVSTKNHQERILQQHILKEVETIHKAKSMKIFPKVIGSQENNQAILENNIKSKAILSMENNFLKRLTAATSCYQEQQSVNSNDTDLTKLKLEAEQFDEEIKSTVID